MNHLSLKSAEWRDDERSTIVDLFGWALATTPDKPFIDFGMRVFTHRELDTAANRYANGLQRLGVRKGHTVVTLLDNGADAVLVALALFKLGAISVPVNTAYKGDFLRHQIADAGAAIVIAEHDYAGRVSAVASKLPELKLLLHRGEAPAATNSLATAPLADLDSEDTGFAAADVQPGDIATLIYTGGTTGPSKGCMVSHNYAVNLTRQLLKCQPVGPDDVIWTCLPLFHLNALSANIFLALMCGGRAVIFPRFSVSQFWPEMERSGATMVNLMGAMIPLLAGAEPNDAEARCHGQLRIVGAAPFPHALEQVWRNRFGVKYTGNLGYGLTEAALLTSAPIDEPYPPDSSGKRNEDFDVRIVDDDLQEMPAGTPGEVVVRPRRPDIMFEGYWRRPEDTLRVTRNLWFHTGDIGRFDEEGFFYFVDRKKDYLRRRGENISSFEMEATFLRHPHIEDCAVHAVPSALTEDDVKITAVLKPGATLTVEDLCLWSFDNVPYFAVPRYFEFRAALPRNPLGRLLKYQLRDDGVTPATFDREAAGLQPVKR